MGAIAGQATSGNPAGAVSIMLQPNPKALQPSNQTQADVSKATEVGLGIGTALIPGLGGESTEAALTRLATKAVETLGPGRGPQYGTAVHRIFARLVQKLGKSNLTPEVSYKGGQVVEYGTPGSIRVDVVEGPINAPTATYDLKTGGAQLTPQRTQQIQNELPGGSNVPVNQIKPQQ